MHIFDLHCDTATVLYRKNLSFDNHVTHLNATSLGEHTLTQCFAVFLNDTKPQPEGLQFFKGVAEEVFPRLHRSGLTPILTVEGAGVLANFPQWIDTLKQYGCRMAGLAWNGKNPLATGALTNDKEPLTPMGSEAVIQLGKAGITIDVSHLSTAGTEEVLTLTQNPVVASHSNAKAICNHLRNLSDEMAKEIFRRGGLVGLNLYPEFLSCGPATLNSILRHAEHFFLLGGENGVALGCDLDGVDRLPEGMKDFSSLSLLYDRFASAFGIPLAEKVFYKNAQTFFNR